MSKNFELMQNLGKEREMFQTATAPAPLPLPIEPLPVAPRHTEVQPPAEVKPLELKMEAGQRDELLKLVQRVFFAPGGDGSRLVVISGTESGNGCSWICARRCV